MDRVILGGIVFILLTSVMLRLLLVLEIAASLLVAYGLFHRFKVRAVHRETEAQRSADSAATVRSGFIVGALALLLLVAMIFFLTTKGTRRTIFDVLVWASMFTFLWALGTLAWNPLQRAASVGSLFAITVLARAALWYSFPAGLLASDPWFHLSLVNYILDTGRIYPTTTYAAFPALHALIVQVALATGTDPKSAFMVVPGLPMCWVSVAVFLLVRHLYDYKTGFIAAVLTSTSADIFQWGIVLVPTSLAIALAVTGLYALIRYRQRAPGVIIVLICLLTLVLTHTIVAFIFLVILGTFALAARIVPTLTTSRFPPLVRPGFVVLASVTIIGYWMYASGVFPFVLDAISFGFRIESLTPALGSMSESPWLYFYRAGSSVLLALGLIGTLSIIYSLSMARGTDASTNTRVTFALTAWLYAGIESVLLLGALTALFPIRWTAFGSLLQAPLAGEAVLLSQRNVPVRRRQFLGFLIVFSIVSMTLVHPLSNAASILPGDSRISIGFSRSEADAASWVKGNLHGSFQSDSLFTVLFYEPGGGFRNQAKDGSSVLTGRAPLVGWFVYRNVLNNEPGSVLQNGTYFVETFNATLMRSVRDDSPFRIYDDGSVIVVGG